MMKHRYAKMWPASMLRWSCIIATVAMASGKVHGLPTRRRACWHFFQCVRSTLPAEAWCCFHLGKGEANRGGQNYQGWIDCAAKAAISITTTTTITFTMQSTTVKQACPTGRPYQTRHRDLLLGHCVVGLTDRKAGWSSNKKVWWTPQCAPSLGSHLVTNNALRCCQHEGTGCVSKFDCHAGLANWHAGWSPHKKEWCQSQLWPNYSYSVMIQWQHRGRLGISGAAATLGLDVWRQSPLTAWRATLTGKPGGPKRRSHGTFLIQCSAALTELASDTWLECLQVLCAREQGMRVRRLCCRAVLSLNTRRNWSRPDSTVW